MTENYLTIMTFLLTEPESIWINWTGLISNMMVKDWGIGQVSNPMTVSLSVFSKISNHRFRGSCVLTEVLYNLYD